MDLRLMLDRPTTAERDAVDALLGPNDRFNGRVVYGGHAARAQRHLLLPVLHAVQDVSGSVSNGALAYICERLTIPPAEAYGVATFYALFDVGGSGGSTIHVCDDIVCAQYGAEDLCAQLDEKGITYERSPCLGQCDRPPAAMFHQPGVGYGNAAPLTADSIASPVFDELPPGMIHQDRSELTLLRGIGTVDPTSLDSYMEAGGFENLAKAREMGADAVISELKK